VQHNERILRSGCAARNNGLTTRARTRRQHPSLPRRRPAAGRALGLETTRPGGAADRALSWNGCMSC